MPKIAGFKKLFPYFFISIIFINLAIWYSALAYSTSGKLTVSFLNIGQGDAIYIEAPNGNQVIVDGGPDRKIMSELGAVMPLGDTTIDALIITNPDKDHMAGFLDVMDKYKVDKVFEPGTFSKTDTYKAIEKTLQDEGVERIIAKRGMEIVMDAEKNVYIEILFPDKDVSKWSTNDGSIVAKLVYGNTSVLLQGDAPQKTETYLLSLDKNNLSELDGDILKVGHHGSRTSTNKSYIEAISPQYAVVSLGKDNRYGHPHKETLDTLNSLGLPILRTDILGRITFESDGEKFILK
jgi:competence protein ComEC